MSDEWKPSLSKPNVVCDKILFASNRLPCSHASEAGEYELLHKYYDQDKHRGKH